MHSAAQTDAETSEANLAAKGVGDAARSAGASMTAATYDRYGPLDVVAIRTVARPEPAENQVRVRVHAAGLHIGDCFGVHGKPLPVRMETGWRRPKLGIPGYDVAGVVEAVGPDARRLQPGDEVFGTCHGSCAEYAVATEAALVPKPAGLSFEQAAALPTSGLAALHALRDVGKVQSGQRVLINGASGGVGSFAVQIAKAYGAEVTGVCSTRNLEMVRSLGADHVIDYTQADFTRGDQRYDLILDNVENRALAEVRRALEPEGTLILNSGTGATGLAMLARMLEPLVRSPFSSQSLRRFLSVPKQEDLVALSELAAAGQLRPAIDRTYPLAETRDALAHIETGHARGKVVVQVLPVDAG